MEQEQDADSETISDMVEAFGVPEYMASEVLNESYKALAEYISVDVLSSLTDDDPASVLVDLQKLLRLGRILPIKIPAAENFMDYDIKTKILSVWKGFGQALQKSDGQEVEGQKKLGLDKVTEEQREQMRESFERDEKILFTLLGMPEVTVDLKEAASAAKVE